MSNDLMERLYAARPADTGTAWRTTPEGREVLGGLLRRARTDEATNWSATPSSRTWRGRLLPFAGVVTVAATATAAGVTLIGEPRDRTQFWTAGSLSDFVPQVECRSESTRETTHVSTPQEANLLG